MYAMPRHDAPTTFPTFPEKPPKIPFLIVPISLNFFMVNNFFYLDLVRLWYGFDLIQIQKYKGFWCLLRFWLLMLLVAASCYKPSPPPMGWRVGMAAARRCLIGF
jgi:hypothetical protein